VNLKLKYDGEEGYSELRQAERDGGLIDFGLLRLEPRQDFGEALDGKEAVLILMSGVGTVESGGTTFKDIGQRTSVFAGKATAVYLPPGADYRIKAVSRIEVAVVKAAASGSGDPVLISPEDVEVKSVGQWNWKRDVHNIVLGNCPAVSLLVGETFNPPGNWSSYPPHKHDVDDLPWESKLEEIYHFRVNPEQGFGIQRIYTADRSLDEIYTVENGDTVIIPEGYHPVAAAPGYQLYYLWMLAGDRRVMRPNDDPAHAWVKAMESLLANMP